MKSFFRTNTFAFLAIVLVHVLYKMLFLDEYGFWHDEAFSLYYSQQHWGHIKHISEWDINPPLYYYFLWIWQHLFGIGEYAVRFSSVIFSSLSAGMLYVLCARHFNKLAGLVVVLLFTASSEMYFYAHEARPYSLILLFALCSTWFFFELLRKPNWVNAIFLGLLNFGLIYTHYVSGIILLIQTILIFVYRNKALLKFFGIAMGVTILIALLRFTKKTIMLIFHNKQSSFWIQKPTFEDLKETIYSFMNGPDLFYIFLIAGLISLLYLIRNKEWTPIWKEYRVKVIYLLSAGLGAIVICFLISLSMPLFVRRYLLFTAPFIYILFGWFISLSNQRIRQPIMATVIIFVFFSLMRVSFHTPRSMDYRNAVAFVKGLKSKNLPVLMETPDVTALFAYYYNRDIFADYERISDRLREQKVFPVKNIEDVKSVNLKSYNGFILTQTFQELNPEHPKMLKYLNGTFKLRKTYTNYPGIVICFYTRL